MFYVRASASEPFNKSRPDFTANVLYLNDMMWYGTAISLLNPFVE